MSGDGTLRRIAAHLAEAMRPLEDGFRDPEEFRRLLLELGWEVPGLPPSYVTVADKAVQAAKALEALADDAGIDQVVAVVTKAGDVYRAVGALTEAPAGIDPAVFLPGLGRRLFELLLARQLLAEAPGWFATLHALGVIVMEDTPAAGGRPGFTRVRFDWDQLPAILRDPGLVPARLYGWGTNALDFEKLAQVLAELASALGLPNSQDRLSPALAAQLQAGATGPPARMARRALTAVLFDIPVDDRLVEVGLMLAELPPEGAAPAGLILLPLVPDGISERVDLGDGWTFTLRAGTDVARQLGVVVRPGEVLVRYPGAPGQPLPSGGFGIALAYDAPEPLIVFGQPGRTRLELAAATAALSADVKAGDLELKAAAGIQQLTLVLSPGDADGFLAAVLGARELHLDLRFGLGWSSRTGLDVLAGGGFATAVYPHLDLGLVRFDRVDLEVRLAAGTGVTPALEARAAASFSGEIGPVAYSVDRLGVTLPVRFADGNAGPFDVRLQPLWPTGLGLVVDAGPVTGGGFLFFDPKKEQYTGALQLEFSGIALKAVGLLTTRLPGGASGFSLLVIVSAEFTPMQLGLGFTLTGVGGLLGINRVVAVEPLRAGLKSGTLAAILFPADPVSHAQQLVATLSTVFPAAAGRHVFGPMARIEWGTPTLLTIDICLVLELPAPERLIVLGRLRAVLPDEDAAVVRLQMDVLGVIDFDRREAAADATLVDSRLASFPLTGAMAMRLSWDASPAFLLAVGGFNPRFLPPPGFPRLDRIAVALATGDNPRLRLEAYLALTSNTVQFGARLDLSVTAGPFTVAGFLSFDALVQPRPLSFVVDIAGALAVRAGGHTILSVTLQLALSGPEPWRARGRASFSILFFDVSVSFDVTIGREPPPALPETVQVAPLLLAALGDVRSWSAQLPVGGEALVTLRALAPARQVLAHPLGILRVRQRVVPLERTLDRFGSDVPAGARLFRIAGATLGGAAAQTEPLEDLFAPAQFSALSDDQKLSQPSFVPMRSGVRVGEHDVAHGAPVSVEVVFEQMVVPAPGGTG
ncbi:MAG TPA: DUF6603 domain-containing protein [Actinomycetes bacterium]|nr:DUF6603 domain-containing protein [Actinomycetes bacterium]